MRSWAAVLLLACVSACSSKGTRASAPPQENAALGGEVVARVDGEPIPRSVVAGVAAAQKIGVDDAVQRLVDDAVAARAAKVRGLDRRPPAAWQLEATRARLTSNRLRDEAVRAGPPSDEEVAQLSAIHWVEVDRPPSVRVVHAILIRPRNPADAPAVKSASLGLRAAVARAEDPAAFEALAKAYFAGAGTVASSNRVETLPAFTAEGRITDGAGGMDPSFAAAAFAIPAIGGTSSVVETSFGWHVIRLLERIPERRMPIEMRRLAFADEVIAYRAHDLLVARLNALKATHPIAISEAADELMQSVSRNPPSP